ncbi:MAG: HAD family hydrolase [Pseudomonadales bacterium]
MSNAARYDWLLLDNDGVLVDSERYYFLATQEAFAAHGQSLSLGDDREAQRAGGKVWQRFADPQLARQARAWRDQRYQSHLRSAPIDIPGIQQTLTDLAGRLTMAIVSTAKPEDFALIHDQRELVQHMSLVLVSGDYPRAKPAPDPYLTAMARLGARPERTLAVEDSVRGMQAALAAGIDCVVVASEFQQGESFSQATYQLERFEQLPAVVDGSFRSVT